MKEVRIYNGAKTASQRMVLGKLDSYMWKNETGCLSHIIHKNQLKMNTDLNIRSETKKLLIENISKTYTP